MNRQLRKNIYIWNIPSVSQREATVDGDGTDLEPQIDQEADDECSEEALPSRSTDSLWKLCRVAVACLC